MRSTLNLALCATLLLLLCPLRAAESVRFTVTLAVKGVHEIVNDVPCLRCPIAAAQGNVLSGVVHLEAGRYLVRLPLAATPFGTKKASVTCSLSTPGAPVRQRELVGSDFPADGAPLPITWDISLPAASDVRLSVDWANNTILPAPKTAIVKEAVPGDPMDKTEGQETPAQPPIRWELSNLYVFDITATRLDGGLALTSVQASKVLYQRGEHGGVSITVRNYTTTDQTAGLSLALIQELGREVNDPLTPFPVTVPAGAEIHVTLPFTCGQRQFGCEVRIVLLHGEKGKETTLDTRSDYFNVDDNMWEVGIGAAGSSAGSMSGYANDSSLAYDARVFRENYFNWWEKMFWPPDDWGDMVPTQAEWISGQSARYESAKNIKAFIALVKPQGIKSISYAKNTAGGPEGWELARKHLEWYYTDDGGHINGSFNTWDLANWHDIKLHTDKEGRKKYASDWWGLMPDLRQQVVLDWGINQILESAKQYGWDGVRFDGHFTAGNDELSTANQRRLKDALWAYDPHFLFGFNMSWSYGYQTSFSAEGMLSGYDHELRELMAGGGQYMQEAINHWAYASGGNQVYTSWHDYATKEVAGTNGVRKLGGSYHFIYAISSLTPVARLYKFALGTAAGIHPVYGDSKSAPGCDNWGRFLTRWSAFVWDTHLQPVAPAGAVDVQSARPLWWQDWVKERVADATTRQLIVHLINPPADDAINHEALLPAPLANITVRVKVPAGQTFTRAILLDPRAGVDALPLTAHLRNGWAEITVPRVEYWAIVAAEFNGKFSLPADGPRYSEPPDPAKVAAGRGLGKAPTYDPAKPAETLGQKANTEWQYVTDSGYSSVPARAIADPGATSGRAQVRDAGETSVYIGRSWLGPFAPGKYLAKLHVKLDDKATPPHKQSMRFTLYEYPEDIYKPKNFQFGTAEYHYAPEQTLVVDGKYHDYTFVFEIPIGMVISIIGGAYVPEKDESRLLIDRIVVQQTEAYTDEKLAVMQPLEPPAGLQPAKDGSILVAKGWTWDAYQLDKVLPALAGADHVTSLWSNSGDIIGFPQKHEDLYKYNVVVLADVGAFAMNYAGRKVLHDFVRDGGGLIILGGPYTLGQGNFPGTFLEDLLPVTLSGGKELLRADKPLLFGPGRSPLSAADWQQHPAVYWMHKVTPKPGAAVQLTAGDQPLVVTNNYGKGFVAVFTCAALGEAHDNTIPCWEWSGWPKLLDGFVRWAKK